MSNDTHHDSPSPRRAALQRLVAGVLGILLVACAVQLTVPDAAPQDWWDQRGPVVPHDSFPADCSLCHVGPGWNTIRADFEYDHGRETGFALEGAHRSAECLRCHNDRGPVQWFAAKGCGGCHVDPHLERLGPDCAQCHDQGSWRAHGVLAEHQSTRFPLLGAHLTTACALCHPGAEAGQYTGVSTRCEDCHLDDAVGAQSFDHVAAGNLVSCEQCHQPTVWSGAGIVHTFFPLTDGHALSDCTACHTPGTFEGLSQDCFSCHADDYAGTTDPNHVTAGFSTACQTCHTTQGWDGANFDHGFFPLTAGHALTDCTACHTPGNFGGLSQDCFSCHADDYAATTDPNHLAAGFPTACQACHTTVTWDGANFAHSFPINTGDHAGLDCADCHTTPGVFPAFSCTHCHEHSFREASDEHDDVPGFVWNSSACFACHPDGQD